VSGEPAAAIPLNRSPPYPGGTDGCREDEVNAEKGSALEKMIDLAYRDYHARVMTVTLYDLTGFAIGSWTRKWKNTSSSV
jgi:hypothetical protein